MVSPCPLGKASLARAQIRTQICSYASPVMPPPQPLWLTCEDLSIVVPTYDEELRVARAWERVAFCTARVRRFD